MVWGLQGNEVDARVAEKRFESTAAAAAYTAGKVSGKLSKGFVCGCPERLAALKEADRSTPLSTR